MIAEADYIELNLIPVERHGLDRPEIAQLRESSLRNDERMQDFLAKHPRLTVSAQQGLMMRASRIAGLTQICVKREPVDMTLRLQFVIINTYIQFAKFGDFDFVE